MFAQRRGFELAAERRIFFSCWESAGAPIVEPGAMTMRLAESAMSAAAE